MSPDDPGQPGVGGPPDRPDPSESTSQAGHPPSPRRGQPGYDQALKWMATHAPDAFLQLITPGLRWHETLSAELPAVPRQADLVWEVVRPDGQHALLHIELQTKVDPDIGQRLLEYGVRLYGRPDHPRLPLRSIVVYERETANVPEPPHVIPWQEEQPSGVYWYEVVKLWEIPPEPVLTSDAYVLWPLAPLLAGGSVERTVEVAERLAQAPLPRDERSSLIGLLTLLAGVRLDREAVLSAIRRYPMLDELLRESSVAAAFIEEGRAEGEAKGRAEGKAEEARRLAQVALEGRFGPLPEDIRAALGSSELTMLEAVVAHVSSDTLEEVRARLGLR